MAVLPISPWLQHWELLVVTSGLNVLITLPEKKDRLRRRGDTMASAARSTLDAGSSFAVSGALDITGKNESPLGKLGEKGIQGSSPASQGSKMANWPFHLAVHDLTQCWEGRRCEGRQVLVLACAHKGQKTGLSLAKCSVLVGSVRIHQTSHCWKYSPCFRWMLLICFEM